MNQTRWLANPLLTILLSAGLAITAGTAISAPVAAQQAEQPHSLEQDFQQPIVFEADEEFMDWLEGKFNATGNIRISQGTLLIEADRMDVEGFSSDGNEPEIFIVTGSPATYQQQIQPGMLAQAHAETIRYDATTRILTLEGSAELRQGDNQVNAARIVFNIEAQQVRAERGDDDSQVRTTVQPRPRNNSENNGDNDEQN